MADQKISQLTELAEGDVATTDEVAIVDTSATSTKKFTWSSLRSAIATFYDTATRTLTNKTLTSPVINTPTGIVKGDVGLGNVDNTSDANKPVSTAQQTALDLKANLASPTFTGTVTLPSGQALIAPALGTPASGVMTNVTGLPTSGLVDDAVTLAKMAAGTAGNLITYDASGNPAAVATGTSGQVLTSNGAGAAPTFQAAASGGGTALTLSPYPNIRPFTATTHNFNDNTSMSCLQIIVPFEITVNKISIGVTAVTTAGTVKLALYSEDGATKVFEVETASISAAATVTTSLASATVVAAGIYYIAILPTSTAQVTCGVFNVFDGSAEQTMNVVTSEPIIAGIITVTASTIPSTLTLASLSSSTARGLKIRLDN